MAVDKEKENVLLYSSFQRGQYGETIVKQAIMKCCESSNKEVRVFNNVIIKSESVYGEVSIELDHVIVVGSKVILVETKNTKYKKWYYKDELWQVTRGGPITRNPIEQNHSQKKFFCDVFSCDLEEIITVEVLLGQTLCKLRSHYPNDYVLGVVNYEYGLASLIMECEDQILLTDLCSKLEVAESTSNDYREKHKDNKERFNRLKKMVQKCEGEDRFAMTDRALCPICQSNLRLEMGRWKRPGDTKKTKNIILKCTNESQCTYFCDSKIVNKKGFRHLKTVKINERNNWKKENHIKRQLDELYE